MAEKDKLSKEIEEQIQSLASDVYIQIEEKLTQLICAAAPNGESDAKQSHAYIALQQTNQTSQNEFSLKVKELEVSVEDLKIQLTEKQELYDQNKADEQKNHTDIMLKNSLLVETVERLEHENNSLKKSLAQDKVIYSSEQQSLKHELDGQTSTLRLTIENLTKEISDKTEQLQSAQSNFNVQEQILIEQLDIVEKQKNNSEEKLKKSEERWQKSDELQTSTLIEQKKKVSQLSNQLKASNDNLVQFQEQYQRKEESAKQTTDKLQQLQRECSEQVKEITEQKDKILFLEDKVKQHVKTSQDYKQELTQLNEQQANLEAQQLEEHKRLSLLEKQQQQAQESSLQKIVQLESKNQDLVESLITEQSDVKLYEKEVESLKSQVKLAQEGQENLLHRFNTNRDKQEKDNNQVRETIKFLRDENSDMITQHNEKKEQLLEQIHDLESKLTEYRLKFEYAQKQLTQNSNN